MTISKRMSKPGIKKQLPPLPAKQAKVYDDLLREAFTRLDGDDYQGFWDILDDLNAFVKEVRG